MLPGDRAPMILNVEDVAPRRSLHARDGWVDVDIRFMTEALGVQGRGITLFRTVLPPGAIHMPHVHAHADEFVFIVSGSAQLGEDDRGTPGGPGTFHYAQAGRVHWTGNRSDALEPVELVGGYVGADSLAAAGYEPIEAIAEAVRALIEHPAR